MNRHATIFVLHLLHVIIKRSNIQVVIIRVPSAGLLGNSQGRQCDHVQTPQIHNNEDDYCVSYLCYSLHLSMCESAHAQELAWWNSVIDHQFAVEVGGKGYVRFYTFVSHGASSM